MISEKMHGKCAGAIQETAFIQNFIKHVPYAKHCARDEG